MAVFEIWVEGYAVESVVSCTAQRLGYGEGLNFIEACRNLESMDYRFAGCYQASDNTFSARRLFDNETDARASYG